MYTNVLWLRSPWSKRLSLHGICHLSLSPTPHSFCATSTIACGIWAHLLLRDSSACYLQCPLMILSLLSVTLLSPECCLHTWRRIYHTWRRIYFSSHHRTMTTALSVLVPAEAHVAHGWSALDSKQSICSNCKKPQHTAEFCIQPNRGMAGKSIVEAQQAHDAKWGKKPKDKTSKGLAGTSGNHFLWYKQRKRQQIYLIVTILFYKRYFIHLPGVFLSHKACNFFHYVGQVYKSISLNIFGYFIAIFIRYPTALHCDFH